LLPCIILVQMLHTRPSGGVVAPLADVIE